MVSNYEVAYACVKPNKPAAAFPKQKRFKETKLTASANADYTPKVDAVKRRAAQPTIAPLPKKPAKSLLESGLTDLETQASIGPGQYSLNFEQVEAKKVVGFAKDERFKAPKTDDLTEITPSYEAVLPRPPTAIMYHKLEIL